MLAPSQEGRKEGRVPKNRQAMVPGAREAVVTLFPLCSRRSHLRITFSLRFQELPVTFLGGVGLLVTKSLCFCLFENVFILPSSWK